MCHGSMWSSEDSLQGLVLSYHHEVPGMELKVRLGGRHLNPLSQREACLCVAHQAKCEISEMPVP